MAIFHQHISHVSRRSGRSSVQSAAYILGEKLYEERRGIAADYRNKSENGRIVDKGTVIPEGVNKKFENPECLWNAAEKEEDNYVLSWYKTSETQQDKLQKCRTAETDEFSLPKELSSEAHREIVTEYIKYYIDKGHGVSWAIHQEEGNPHVHFQVTCRSFNEDSTFHKRKDRSIASRVSVHERRQLQAEITNKVLEKYNIDARVDARSFEDQGIELTPTIHEGWQARNRVEKGQDSILVDLNDSIKQENAEKLMEKASILFGELTKNNATFSQGDVLKAVQNRTLDNPSMTQYVYETVMKNAVVLGEDFHGNLRYTSPEYHKKEQNMLTNLEKMVDTKVTKIIDASAVSSYIKDFRDRGEKMSEEQEQAVRNLCSDRQLSVLVGRAGTGKTTGVLKPFVDLHKQAGFSVMGMSLAAEAAQNLAKETGCKSHAMEYYLYRWDKIEKLKKSIKYGKLTESELNRDTKTLEKFEKILPTKDTVIIVDEAGMSGTHDWDRLLKMVWLTGAKLVLCGDDNQLKAVASGDVFRLVVQMANDKGFKSELTQIFRQYETWMREASMKLASLESGDALVAYEQRGHVKEALNHELMVKSIADEYMDRLCENIGKNPSDQKFGVIMTSTHKVRLDINTAVRDNMRLRGFLDKETVIVEGKEFSVGDEILFTKNDHSQWIVKSESGKFSVQNGTKGTIHSIKSVTQEVEEGPGKKTINTNEFVVKVNGGKDYVKFTSHDYNNIDHAYAMTVHKCQGKTLDWAIAHFGKFQNIESLYVMLTRHREDVSIHYNREDYETFTALMNSVSMSMKDLAIDYSISESNIEFFGNIQDYKQIAREICFGIKNGENVEKLMNERKNLAVVVAESWDEHKSFAHQAGLSQEKVEMTAGLRVRPLTTHEEKAQLAVEAYVSKALETRDTWNVIRKEAPETGYKDHYLYKGFEEQRLDRGKLASLVVEYGSLSRPYVREAHKEIGYGMRVIENQAEAVKILLMQTDMRERAAKKKDVDVVQKLDTLIAYVDARDMFQSEWANYKNHEKSLKSTLLEPTLKSIKDEALVHSAKRDVLAYKITDDMDNFKKVAKSIGLNLNLTNLFKEAEAGKRHLCIEQYLTSNSDLAKSTAAYELYQQWQEQKIEGKKEAVAHMMSSGIKLPDIMESATQFIRLNLKNSLTTDKENDLFEKLNNYDRLANDYKYELKICFETRLNAQDPFYKSPNYPILQNTMKERNQGAKELLGAHSMADIQAMAERMNVFAKNVDPALLEGCVQDANRTYLMEAYKTTENTEHRLQIAHELSKLIDAEKETDLGIKMQKANEEKSNDPTATDLNNQSALGNLKGKSKTTSNLYHNYGISEKQVRTDALQFHRNGVMKTLNHDDDRLLASQLDQYEEACVKSSAQYQKCKKDAEDNAIKPWESKHYGSYKDILPARDQLAKDIFDIASTSQIEAMAKRLKVSEHNVKIETLIQRAEQGNRDGLITKYLKPAATEKELGIKDKAAHELSCLWKLESALGEKDTIRNMLFAKIDIKELTSHSANHQNNVIYKGLQTGEERSIFKQVTEYSKLCRQTAEAYKTCKTEMDAQKTPFKDTAGFVSYQELSGYRNESAHGIKNCPNPKVMGQIIEKLDIYKNDVAPKTLWDRSKSHETKGHLVRFITFTSDAQKGNGLDTALTQEALKNRFDVTKSASYLVDAMAQEKEMGRGKPTAAQLYQEKIDLKQLFQLASEHKINEIKAEFKDNDPTNSLVDKLYGYQELSKQAATAFTKCIPPKEKDVGGSPKIYDAKTNSYIKKDLKPWDSPLYPAYVELCAKRDEIAKSVSSDHDYVATYVVSDRLKVDIKNVENHAHDHDLRTLREYLFCGKDKVEAMAGLELKEWLNFDTNEQFKSTYRILMERGIVPEDVQNRVDNFFKFRERKQPIQQDKEQAETVKPTSSRNSLTQNHNPQVSMGMYTQTIEKNINSKRDLEELKDALTDKLETIVELLNDKPIREHNNRIMKIGSKGGSLYIHTSGDKRGCFYDFSEGKGGGIFNLISYFRGESFYDSIKWSKEFLGGRYADQPKSIKVHPEKSSTTPQNKSDWTQVYPVPKGIKAPTAQDIVKNKYLNFMLEGEKTIQMIHTYKDQSGNINNLIVRIVDQKGAKTTLPLTLHKNKSNFHVWKWKGIEGERPLFGLENFGKYPTRDILIVEGEKTAEAAQKLYPKLNVMSWSNGAASVLKSDWSSLKGKNVVIWPDNDEGGIKAAKQITGILSDINKDCSKTPRVAIVPIPSSFPEKWDLADKFPKGWDKDKAQELIDKELGVTPKSPLPPMTVERHIALMLKENYQLEKDDISQPLMKTIYQQVKLMDSLYKAEKITMSAQQKNHHIKQACYIAIKTQENIDFYSSETPLEARKKAVMQTTFESFFIKKTGDIEISVKDLRMEEMNVTRNQFDHAVLKTQENIQQKYTNIHNSTAKMLAESQVMLTALTGNKIEATEFVRKKVDALASNNHLLDKAACEIAMKPVDPDKLFEKRETISTAKCAIIHEILRQEPSTIKCSHSLVDSARKSINEDIKLYQEYNRELERKEQQMDRKQVRDNQMTI